MGRTERISNKEIQGFIEDGWNFRVKKTGGKSYITRRKGQKERGLGPYNKELWDLITELTNPTTKTRIVPVKDIEKSEAVSERDEMAERVKELTGKIDEGIMMYRGFHMMKHCLYNSEGFCEYWRWEERPSFFDAIDDLLGPDSGHYSRRRGMVVMGITERWMIRASIPYCATCSAYVSINDIMTEQASLSAKLDRNLSL